MAKSKVEAPNRDYNGPGPGGVTFEDGVAYTDDEAALNYYRAAGYAVNGDTDNPVEKPEPPDPREVTEQKLGTPLRDAAVDPEPGDFLAPTNAGEDNPHGSTVVSPEIHASGPAGIRPGVVFVEDPAKQEKRETAFAESRLVDGVSVGEAVKAEVPDLDERGALDLSDPGSAEVGAEAAKEVAAAEAKVDDADEQKAPAKKAAAKKAAKSGAKKSTAKKATKKAPAKKAAASSSEG